MKVLTVAGTRPELIRLSRIIPALDEVCDHTFVWTGQNYDPRLSDVFFEELGVRRPDVDLAIAAGHGGLRHHFGWWVGHLLEAVPGILKTHKPDKLLVLGDTNSAMSAYVAKRMGIPVYHMEAGNRCYDDRVPEEVNRRVIDACSDVLLPYTQRSRDNLLAVGYPARRIHVTGNPIMEVLAYYQQSRSDSDVLERLGLHSGGYFLATAHRAENVDDPVRLQQISEALYSVANEFEKPVIVSTHPRTRDRMEQHETGKVVLGRDRLVRWLEPMGFHDFVALEEQAYCVLSDSGTVQEECCIMRVPSVTMRDTTERPETIDCGSNVVAGLQWDRIVEAVRAVTSNHLHWLVPEEYLEGSVSRKITRILMSEVPR